MPEDPVQSAVSEITDTGKKVLSDSEYEDLDPHLSLNLMAQVIWDVSSNSSTEKGDVGDDKFQRLESEGKETTC
jgi:hypothetical protein